MNFFMNQYYDPKKPIAAVDPTGKTTGLCNQTDPRAYQFLLAELERMHVIFTNELTKIEFADAAGEKIWNDNAMQRKFWKAEYQCQKYGVSAFVFESINGIEYCSVPERVIDFVLDLNEKLMGIFYLWKPVSSMYGSSQWFYRKYGYTSSGQLLLVIGTGSYYDGKFTVDKNNILSEEIVDEIPAVLIRTIDGLPLQSRVMYWMWELAHAIKKGFTFIEANGQKLIIKKNTFSQVGYAEQLKKSLTTDDLIILIEATNVPLTEGIMQLNSVINFSDIQTWINWNLKRVAEIVLLPEHQSQGSGVKNQQTPEVVLGMAPKLDNLKMLAKIRKADLTKVLIKLGASANIEFEIMTTTTDDIKNLSANDKDGSNDPDNDGDVDTTSAKDNVMKGGK